MSLEFNYKERRYRLPSFDEVGVSHSNKYLCNVITQDLSDDPQDADFWYFHSDELAIWGREKGLGGRVCLLHNLVEISQEDGAEMEPLTESEEVFEIGAGERKTILGIEFEGS